MVSSIFIHYNMNTDFTQYDVKPENFLNYLRYYGEHFNRKLCEFACEQLESTEYSKEKVDKLLKDYQIQLNNAKLYDAVYVANFCNKHFYKSSIKDEQSFVLFIKDTFETQSNLIFNRWYADMAKQGVPIEWEDMV